MAASQPAEGGGMNPALYKAATHGCVVSLRKFGDPEVLINSKTPQGNTALHVAALHGHAKFAREVLKLTEELLVARNADGDTPLHLAARNGALKVAELIIRLVQARADHPNTTARTDLDSDTKAARAEDPDTKERAEDSGDAKASAVDPGDMKAARAEDTVTKASAEDPGDAKARAEGRNRNIDDTSPLTMKNHEGNTPLHEAVRHQHTDVALKLLVADSKCAHDLNKHRESPLDMAARQGLFQVVRRIVDVPWVPDKAIESVGVTALHQAVLGGHTRKPAHHPFSSSSSLVNRCVQYNNIGTHTCRGRGELEIMLEKHRYLLDHSDAGGNNALHYAAQKDNKRVVKILLKERTRLAYKRNGQDQTPLHVAAHHGSTSAIGALLQQCPDVAEMTDAAGRNAFHTAVASGKTDALRCLLRNVRPAELLNRADGEGNTPLLLAAEMSHVQSALLLVRDSRVNPCVRNRKDQTARSLLEARTAQDRTTHSEVKIRTVDGGGVGGQQPHTHLEIRSVDGEMDAYEMYLWKELKRQESKKCRKQQLPPVSFTLDRRTSHKYFERSVETYILVATLIATVTFAATFTMPGGYDQTKGIALHGHNTAFKIFVISNTVAMCSSIIVVFCFIWAWKNPIKFMVDQLLWGHRLTIIACLAMLVSLMTTVYITVAPTSRWPAYVVIAIGMSTPAVVVLILGREVIFVPL
ncbi:unnamed protein product [Urochloa humidicola]